MERSRSHDCVRSGCRPGRFRHQGDDGFAQGRVLDADECSMQAQTLIRQRQSGFVLPFRVVIRIDTKKYTGRAPNNIERRRRQSALICAFFHTR
jgi:hypothetical protein